MEDAYGIDVSINHFWFFGFQNQIVSSKGHNFGIWVAARFFRQPIRLEATTDNCVLGINRLEQENRSSKIEQCLIVFSKTYRVWLWNYSNWVIWICGFLEIVHFKVQHDFATMFFEIFTISSCHKTPIDDARVWRMDSFETLQRWPLRLWSELKYTNRKCIQHSSAQSTWSLLDQWASNPWHHSEGLSRIDHQVF